MRIHNIYADENGESHFRDLEVEWIRETAAGSKQSGISPATGFSYTHLSGKVSTDWHTIARRSYSVNLDQATEIVASDGESRIIKPGEIVLFDDTTGRGHLLKAVDGKAGLLLIIYPD